MKLNNFLVSSSMELNKLLQPCFMHTVIPFPFNMKEKKKSCFIYRWIAYQVQELKENDIPLENVRICYSPFARTRHTAEVVASTLNLPFEGPQCKVSYFIISIYSQITIFHWRREAVRGSKQSSSLRC